MQFPHLIVTGLQDIEFEIAQEGFVVVDSQAHAISANADKLVIIRYGQRWKRAGRRYVEDHLATPAIAWVDLYREVRNGRISLGAGRLGEILAVLAKQPDTQNLIKSYSKEWYGNEVENILKGVATSPFTERVIAGYQQ